MDEKLLTVRVPENLMKLVQSVARARDETLSQVVRRALVAYADSAPRQSDLVTAARASAAQPAKPSKAKRSR